MVFVRGKQCQSKQVVEQIGSCWGEKERFVSNEPHWPFVSP